MTQLEFVFGEVHNCKQKSCSKCGIVFDVKDIVITKKLRKKPQKKAYHKACWEKLFQ